MNFWQFFNESPIVGLLFSVVAIVCTASLAEIVVKSIAGVFVAKYTGCGHGPCELEHVETEEEDTENGSEAPK